MTTREILDLQNQALMKMAKEARTLDIRHGAAVAFVMVGHSYDFHNVAWIRVGESIQRGPDPTREGDRGVNYLGIAFGKLAETLVTGLPSGSSAVNPKEGEPHYRGCLIDKSKSGYNVFAAFSGGTEDQDVEIAKAGIAVLETA